MNIIKVSSLEDISIVGFDIHVRSKGQQPQIIKDGVVALLKGQLILEAPDSNPLSRSDILGGANLMAGSAVLVPEFLHSKTDEETAETAEDVAKDLTDEQLKELEQRLEELQKLKDDLEKQQEELKRKEEEIESKQESSSENDSEVVDEIIEQLEKSIQEMASAVAPPPMQNAEASDGEDEGKKQTPVEGASSGSGSGAAPPVVEEEEEEKLFVEASLASRSDSGEKNDFITNKTSPSFEIKTLPNATITLNINGNDYEVVADSNGNAIINVDELVDGEYIVTVKAKDASGNDASTIIEVIIDTIPPEASFELTSDSGAFDDDNLTNINKPSFSGEITGDPAEVFLDIGEFSYLIPAKNGNFTYTIPDELPDGNYEVKLTVIDAAGNESIITQNIVIDTINEFSVALSDASDTGEKGDWITNEMTPTFRFDHEIGSTIQILYRDQLYDVLVNETPPSTFQFDFPLAEGTHSLEFISVDLAGNKASITQTVVIDTTPPDFEFRGLTDETNTGFKDDLITSNTEPILEGRGEPGSKIILMLDGKRYEALVDDDYKWFIQLDSLPDNDYPFSIYAEDPAGNKSKIIESTLTIDTNGPKIQGGLTADSDSGDSTDGITNANDLTFEATTDIGISVYISIPELGIESVLMSEIEEGKYSFTIENVPEGAYSYSITAVDKAGNVSVNNLSGTVVVDRTIESFSAALSKESDSGFSDEDNLTNETILTVEGTGELGSKVTLEAKLNGVAVTPIYGPISVDENGNWKFTLPQELSDGVYTLSVSLTDAAGNTETKDVVVTIDTKAELTAGLFADANNENSEIEPSNGLTNQNAPVFKGTADANSKITIVLQHAQSGETITLTDFANADGDWQINVSDFRLLVEQGIWTWVVNAEDPAGNNASSVSGNFVFDSIPPQAEIVLASDVGFDESKTNDNTLSFVISSEPNASVIVAIYAVKNGVVSSTPIYISLDAVIIPSSGQISYDASMLPDGDYVFDVTATDPAGNSYTTSSQNITIDTVPPALGSIDLTAASDSNIIGDKITSENELTFMGNGSEVGSRINIVIRDINTGVAIELEPSYFSVDSENWVYTIPYVLPDGEYEFIFTAEDAAGNLSTSSSINIVVDTTPPELGEIGLTVETDSGAAGDFITNDKSPVFRGSSEQNAEITVFIYLKNVLVATNSKVVVNADGTWEVPISDLSDGEYTWKILSKDPAGNETWLEDANQNITIDTTYTGGSAALNDDSNTGSKFDNITNDQNPSISGTAEPNSTAKLINLIGPNGEIINVANVASVIADENGDWKLNLPALSFGDGSYSFTVELTDVAGNTKEITNNLVLDTQTSVDGDLDLTSDSGEKGDGLTNDTTPTFSGTGEKGATIKLVITNSDGVIVAELPGTVDDEESWKISAPHLEDGVYTWRVEAVDVAGNKATSPNKTLTIDTQKPIVSEYEMDSVGAFESDPPEINNTMPSFSGKTSESYGSVVVAMYQVINGVVSGEPTFVSVAVQANVLGDFTVSMTSPLPDGEYRWSIIVTDKAGNQGESPKNSIIIDTIAPSLTNVELSDETSANFIDDQFYTNDNTPSLSGNSEAGTRVYVELFNADGDPISLSPNYVVVKANGSWSFDFELPDGFYSWSVKAQDPAGNESASATGSFILDTVKPTVEFDGLGNDTDSGGNHEDLLTNAERPVFTGTASENAAIEVILTDPKTGSVLFTFTGDAVDGQWSIPANIILPEGEYVIQIKATDHAGNLSDDYVVDTTLVIDRNVAGGEEGSFGLSDATDSSGDNIGIDEDDLTNVMRPALSGTVEAGSKVEITQFLDPQGNAISLSPANIFTDIADENGNWTIYLPSLDGLSDGIYSYSLLYTDEAGNEKTVTGEFVLDTTINVSASFDSETSTDINGDTVYTNKETQNFSGSGTQGDFVRLVIFDNSGTEVFNDSLVLGADGKWKFENIRLPTDGSYSWKVEAEDAAGNKNPDITGNFVKDTTNPVFGETKLTEESDTGFFQNDGITNDNTPTFSVTGEVGATVIIQVWAGTSVSGDPIFESVKLIVPASGVVEYTFAQPFVEGEYHWNVVMTDPAGNSTTSLGQSLTIDTSAPILNSVTQNSILTENNQHYTNDKAFEFEGSGEVGARVYLTLTGPNGTVNVSPLYVTVASDGSWIYKLDQGIANFLQDGKYTWSFVAKDAAGNESIAQSGSINLDTTKPIIGFDGLEDGTDSGENKNDLITNANRPIFEGTASENASIEIKLTDAETGALLFTFTGEAVDGKWRIPSDTDLPEGEYIINIQATDHAGNKSDILVHDKPLVVDRTVEGGDEDSFGLTESSDSSGEQIGSTSDNITNVKNPSISGQVEAGTKVEVITLIGPGGSPVNLAGVNSATSDDNGDWTISLPSLEGLMDGIYTYTLQYTDVAGNVKQVAQQFTLDTSIDVEASFDSKTNTDENSDVIYTNETYVDFSGSGTKGDRVTLTIYDEDGTQIFVDAVLVNDQGKWVIDNIPLGEDGNYSWKVSAEDAAGNKNEDITGNFVKDTTDPIFGDIGLSEATDTGFDTNDGITKETSPTFSIAGEAGASVVIKVWQGTSASGAPIYESIKLVIPSSGVLNHTFENAFAEGEYFWQVEMTDLAGNAVTSDGQNLVIDTTAPPLNAVTQNNILNVDNENYTNNTELSFSGRGEADSRVYLTLTGPNGTVLVSPEYVTVNANGSWTYTLDKSIADLLQDGQYTWSFTAKDLAGNESISQSGDFSLDTLKPTVSFDGLSESTDSGENKNDLHTNATRPVFEGTASEEASIEILLINPTTGAILYTFTGEVINGKWSVAANVDLLEGEYNIKIKATDHAGNQSDELSVDSNLIIDRTVEGGNSGDFGLTPESDSSGDDIGSASDDLTNIRTPSLSGTVEAGSRVEIISFLGPDSRPISLDRIDFVIADDESNWKIDLPSLVGLADGIYSYTLKYTDVAGNEKEVQGQFELDTSIDVNGGFDSETSTDVNSETVYTNKESVSFSGTGIEGDRITLSIMDANGNVINSYPATVNAAGEWAILDIPLGADGTYKWKIEAEDAAGNKNKDITGEFVKDTKAPEFGNLGLTNDTDSGFFQNDNITNNDKPTFSIYGEPGASVVIEVWRGLDATGNPLYTSESVTLIIPPGGVIEYSFPSHFTDGNYVWNVTMTDVAGNAVTSPSIDLTIDTQPPALNAVTQSNIVIDTDTSQNLTNQKEITFSGTGEKEARIYLELTGPDGAITLSPEYVTIDENGNWTYSISQSVANLLKDGSYTWSFNAKDVAGNESAAQTGSFILDTVKPEVAFDGLGEDALGNSTDTGENKDDLHTNASRPVFTGTASEKANIEVKLIDTTGKEYIFTGKAENGQWSITANVDLPEGEYQIIVKATDTAGNVSDNHVVLTSLVIDKTVQGGNEGSFGLSSATDSGEKGDNLTNAEKITLSGTVEKGTEISVKTLSYEGGTIDVSSLLKPKANESGEWTLALPDDLPEGVYNYTLLYTDVAGNTKEVSGSFTVDRTIEITAEFDSETGRNDSDDIYTKNETISFSGTGDEGDKITIVLTGPSGFNQSFEIVVGEDGVWNKEISNLPRDGEYSWSISGTDAAGNETEDITGSFIRDTQAPELTDMGLASESDSGFSDSDNITNNKTPSLNITGEAGASISIEVWRENKNGELVFSVEDLIIPESGVLSVPIDSMLSDGNYIWVVTATDTAGNVTTSSDQNFVIDTTKPVLSDLTLVTDSMGPAGEENDWITKDTALSFEGTAEANSRIYLVITNKLTGEQIALEPDYVTTNAAGEWRYQLSTILSEGSYTVQFEAMDEAGNETLGIVKDLVIDTTPPNLTGVRLSAIADTGESDTDNLTKETRPTFEGFAEVDSTIVITIWKDGSIVQQTEATLVTNSDGSWSIRLENELEEDGNYEWSITATDKAGNVSEASTGNFELDTQVDDVTLGLDAADDTGDSDSDAITQKQNVSVSGDGEEGARVVITSLQYNGEQINISGLNLSDVVENGKWIIDLPYLNQGDGIYTFTVEVIDLAGNKETKTETFEIDISAPTLTVGLKSGEGGSDSGSSDKDGITNVNQPSFVGSVDEKSTVTITISLGNSEVYKKEISNVLSNFEHQLESILPDGTYEWEITAVDVAGNGTFEKGSITIDTVAPSLMFDIDSNDITGSSLTNPVTKETQLSFGGMVSGERADEAIEVEFKILKGKQEVFTDQKTVVANEGFVFDFTAYEDGIYTWKVVVTDLAGNETEKTGQVTVDTKIEDFKDVALAEGSDTGEDKSDWLSNDRTPTFVGKTEAKAELTLTITLAGNEIAVVPGTANADGSFTIYVPNGQALAVDGTYAWTLEATDPAGNSTSTSGNYVLDTAAPEVSYSLEEGTEGTDDEDWITKVTRPVISGTTDDVADVKVSIYLGSALQGQETITPTNGSWEFDLGRELVDGSYRVVISSTDAAGNKTEHEETLIIDTKVRNTFKLDTDSSDGDQITNADPLTFSGQTDTDGKVTFTVKDADGNEIGTYYPEINSETGEWTFTIPIFLEEGHYTFVSVATDAAGNRDESEPYEVEIDRTDPLLFDIELKEESDTGVPDDWITEEKTVTINGMTSKGSKVDVVIAGFPNSFPAFVDDEGKFSITLPTLNFGIYELTFVATDAAGNKTYENRTLEISSGVLPFTAGLAEDSDSGAIGDNITNDKSPTLTGGITPGYELEVYINGTLYPVTISDRGVWTVDITTELPDNTYAVSFNVKDLAGNAVPTDNYQFTIDTKASVTVSLDKTSDTGALDDDFVTNAHYILAKGTVDPGSYVTITNKASGTIVHTFTSLTGEWTHTFSGLADGEHTFTVSIEDPAGNTASKDFTITVDRTPPPIHDLMLGSEAFVSSKITNDKNQVITGRVEPDSGIHSFFITINNQDRPINYDEATGQFTINMNLTEGMNNIVITVSDLAGNKTIYNANISVKTQIIFDMTVTNDDGMYSNDQVLSDDKIMLTGVGDEGDKVKLELYDAEGNLVETLEFTVDATGRWNQQFLNLVDGTYYIVAKISDEAGNSAEKPPSYVTIDNQYKDFSAKLDDLSGDDSDNIVNTGRPSFSGTGEPESTVYVVIDGQRYPAIVQKNGTWFLPSPIELADGDHPITIYGMDAAGNESAHTEFTITVDTQIDDLEFDLTGVTIGRDERTYINEDDSNATFSGVASENGSIKIMIDGQIYERSVVAGEAWSFDIHELATGLTHPYTITFTDVAGNTSSVSDNITVDKSIIISYRLMDIYDSSAPNIGQKDNITNSRQLGFNFTGTDRDVLFDMTVNGPNGFTYTVESVSAVGDYVLPFLAPEDGTYTFSFNFEDTAGNTFENSFNVIVDTAIIGMSETDFSLNGDVFGTDEEVFTNQSNINLNFSNSAASEYHYMTATVDGVSYEGRKLGSGEWIFYVPISSDVNQILISAWDKAGNKTEQTVTVNYRSEIGDITLNVGGNAISDTENIQDIYSNQEDGLLSLGGTVSAGTKVSIIVNGVVQQEITVGDSGAWDSNVQLSEGNNRVVIHYRDIAGNVEEIDFTSVLDTMAPLIAIDGYQGEGYIQINGQHTVIGGEIEITGRIDAGSRIDSVTLNGTEIDAGSISISGGKWQVNVAGLSEGANIIAINGADLAGNTYSQTVTINKDSVVTDFEVNVAPVDNEYFTADESLQFSGVVEKGSSVLISIVDMNTGQEQSFPASVDNNGNWIAYINNLKDGDYSWSIKATDAAGNELATPNLGAGSGNFIVDSEVENFEAQFDGEPTSSDLPSFSGTVEEGSTVIVTLTNTLTGQTVNLPAAVQDNGSWSLDVETLFDGDYLWSATATDAAGNELVKPGGSFTLDTEVQNLTVNFDSESLSSDMPTFSGTVEEGSSIELVLIDINTGQNYPCVVEINGINWSASASGLPDGEYAWQLVATDVAGNTKPENSLTNFIIDTQVENFAVNFDGEQSSSDMPVFSGTIEEGSSIELILIDINTNQTYPCTVEINGNNWSATISGLPDGEYAWQAIATDLAGNTKPQNSQSNIIVESAANESTPEEESIELISNIVESKIFTGESEPESSVKLSIDNKTYEAKSDLDGDWIIKASFDKPGTYDYKIEFIDAQGKTQTVTGSVNISSVEIKGETSLEHNQEKIDSSSEKASPSSEPSAPQIDDISSNQDDNY